MQFGNSRIPRYTPTLDTGAHVAGDLVAKIDLGRIGSVTNRAVLKNVSLVDAANQKAALTILIFEGSLDGTFTNNSPPVWNAADLAKFVGKIEIGTADYTTVGGEAFATVEAATVIACTKDGLMTAVVVTSGTPTYAVSDLKFLFALLGD